MENTVKIVVAGAGAIGGILAAYLAKEGESVTLIARPETCEKLKGGGLKITGLRGEETVKVDVLPSVADLDAPADIFIIATKCADMPGIAREALPFLKEDSLVIGMQNGITTPELAAIVGKERAVACVVGYGATMHEAGSYELTGEGSIIIGQYGNNSPRLLGAAEILGKIFPTEVTEYIYNEQYSKLIINACITSLGVVCGQPLGVMLDDGKARRIFIGIIREAMAVANKLDLNVFNYAGQLNYYKLVKGKSIFADLKRFIIIKVIGKKYRRLYSSSLQSVKRGKPTEVDYLNGYIARQGKSLGVPTPVNDKLIEMVHEIEAGRREITPENFNEILL